MSYINVGARDGKGMRVKTKKALKELMSTAPSTVRFDVTAGIGPAAGDFFTGDKIPGGYNLSVVGPDPYTKRVWYATVTDTGKVT